MTTLEADDLFVHDGGSVTCVRAPSQPYYVVRTCRRDAAAQAPSGVSSCSCLFHHNLESPPPQRHHPHCVCQVLPARRGRAQRGRLLRRLHRDGQDERGLLELRVDLRGDDGDGRGRVWALALAAMAAAAPSVRRRPLVSSPRRGRPPPSLSSRGREPRSRETGGRNCCAAKMLTKTHRIDPTISRSRVAFRVCLTFRFCIARTQRRSTRRRTSSPRCSCRATCGTLTWYVDVYVGWFGYASRWHAV